MLFWPILGQRKTMKKENEFSCLFGHEKTNTLYNEASFPLTQYGPKKHQNVIMNLLDYKLWF